MLRASFSTVVRRAAQPRIQLSTAAAKASPTLKVEVKNAGPSAAELKEERKETMTKAAASKQSGKSGWQKFVSGVLDVIRPACAAVHTPVMKVLDAPSRRRVQKAASVEDLRIAAEKRMHAMCYGYLAGGADEEVALRRSVDCYKDVELRHAVLHGVGHGEVDPSTTILGHEAKLPFFVTSCAGLEAASFSDFDRDACSTASTGRHRRDARSPRRCSDGVETPARRRYRRGTVPRLARTPSRGRRRVTGKTHRLSLIHI